MTTNSCINKIDEIEFCRVFTEKKLLNRNALLIFADIGMKRMKRQVLLLGYENWIVKNSSVRFFSNIQFEGWFWCDISLIWLKYRQRWTILSSPYIFNLFEKRAYFFTKNSGTSSIHPIFHVTLFRKHHDYS